MLQNCFGSLIWWVSVWALLLTVVPRQSQQFKPENLARMDNGDQVPIGSHKWPFMVSVLKLNPSKSVFPKHSCGGTLVNSDTVMTAASCLHDAEIDNLFVYFGTENVTRLGYPKSQFSLVKKVLIYPYFNLTDNRYDMAILVLTFPIHIGKDIPNVKPVCLPPDQDENKYNRSKCVVLGWGFNEQGRSNFILKEHDVSIPMDEEVCGNLASSFLHYYRDEMLCAGKSEHLCQYDKGGPLICPLIDNPKLYVQLGIVSFDNNGSTKILPGFYSRVTFYLDWIQFIAMTGQPPDTI